MTFSYSTQTNVGRVRLLLNDVDSETSIFEDEEIQAFLDLEGEEVKLAAAQAIDTNADNEALASKVLNLPNGTSTNGPSVADALRKRADSLRAQYLRDKQRAEEDSDDGVGFFRVVPGARPHRGPELTW